MKHTCSERTTRAMFSLCVDQQQANQTTCKTADKTYARRVSLSSKTSNKQGSCSPAKSRACSLSPTKNQIFFGPFLCLARQFSRPSCLSWLSQLHQLQLGYMQAQQLPHIRCCCILSQASCTKLVQTTGCSRFRLWPSLPWRQPRWLLGTLLGPGGVQHISQHSEQLPYTPRASCGVQPTCHMGFGVGAHSQLISSLSNMPASACVSFRPLLPGILSALKA